MAILISISTVLFVILCILLVIIILLQSDKSAGMGVLGGSSQSAFGSSTADVITKISAVMIAIFMLGSLSLAILESKRSDSVEDVMKEKSNKTGIMVSDKKKEAEKSDKTDKQSGKDIKDTTDKK